MKQQAVRFGDRESLSGIVTYPDDPLRGAPAVIFLTAGVIHRVGPNGLYARLCRELAARGIVTLRFDFSGVGDSPPRPDHLVFSKSSILESQAAMDFLAETTGAQRFVMAGLCSGAFAAVKAAGSDPRVSGAIVINAQTLRDGDQNDFQAYAANRSVVRHLINPRTWLKVLDGTAQYGGKVRILTDYLAGAFRKGPRAESARAIAAELHDLVKRDLDLLFIYSKGDPGHDYFMLLGEREIERLTRTGRLHVEVISATDHIFAPPEAFDSLLRVCGDWLERHCNRVSDDALSAPAVHLPLKSTTQIASDSSLSPATRA